jgi:hypothetical protein
MAAAAAGGGGGGAAEAAEAAVSVIPENWKVIEVTDENLEKLMPGLDKEAFFADFLQRKGTFKACGYKGRFPPTKIEDIYPQKNPGIPHPQIAHLYLLIDVTTPVREGYGILALLSIESLSPYNALNELIKADMRYVL